MTYKEVRVKKGHPLEFRKRGGGIREHRLVMENELLNYDKPEKMHVHHLDGNKRNNSRKNLVVVNPKEHRRLENGWKLIDNKWFKNCPKCNLFLEVNTENFYKCKRKRGKLDAGGGEFFFSCKKCSIKASLKYLKQKYYA